MRVNIYILTAIPSEYTTSACLRLGRTSCAFILSASGVSLSLQAHLNPIGYSQYTSLMVVALLCLLRTLRTLLIPNSKINCCARAFLQLSLLCCFSSSFVKRSRCFLISDLRAWAHLGIPLITLLAPSDMERRPMCSNARLVAKVVHSPSLWSTAST